MHPRTRKLLLTTTALFPLGLTAAFGNPLGGQVVGGSATIQGQGTASVTVNQTSNRAIINWNTFNIAAGEKTQFVQPSSSSVALNRVTGGLGPSQIYGSLQANGQIFVVNPDGILVGPGARIDTAGFLATTHDIANADFMAGRYNFSVPGNPTASIVNQGTITARSGGFAALVAPGVRNSGTITARLGRVALASGNSFSLDFYGDNLITLGLSDAVAADVKDVATGKSLASLVDNSGKLKANGGTVELTAVSARRVVDSVINTRGVIEAHSIGTHNGRIVLGAPTAGTKVAGAPVQSVKIAGKLSVAGKRTGTTGGKIVVTGEDIALAGAKLAASGVSGGGTVLIGGDRGAATSTSNLAVDDASWIDVSATQRGDGGTLRTWANSTIFAGYATARGGHISGNGGLVETSGGTLNFSGARIDTSSPRGETGAWLLDPFDLTIDSSAATTISNNLATSNVHVETTTAGSSGPGISNASGNGDIIVTSSIDWSSNNTLTLSAYQNIKIQTGTISNHGAGNLILHADNSGTGTGTVLLLPQIRILYCVSFTCVISTTPSIDFSTGTGSISTYYNPSGGYSSPATYGSAVVKTNPTITNQVVAYMLVNTVDDLQNVSQNLSGTYALGRDVDAGSAGNWNGGTGFAPIGNSLSNSFTGLFYGNGFAVKNLTAPFFGWIGSTGAVKNAIVLDSTIGSSYATAGALASINLGTVTDSSATGSVLTSGFGEAGGLVAHNGGTISRSSAAVDVIGGIAGGLVGVNDGTGVISQSFATGSVSGSRAAGGLVGENGVIPGAIITQSYARGAVTGFNLTSASAPPVGGLVGANLGSTITESYATGLVTGAPPPTNGGIPVGPGSVTGGLVGDAQSGGTFTNNYWDIQTTGQSGTTGSPHPIFVGTGMTTPDLKSGIPTGFDSSVWTINSSLNDGYPALVWQVGTPAASAPTPQPNSTSVSNTPVAQNIPSPQQGISFENVDWQIAGPTTPAIYNANAVPGSTGPLPTNFLSNTPNIATALPNRSPTPLATTGTPSASPLETNISTPSGLLRFEAISQLDTTTSVYGTLNGSANDPTLARPTPIEN